MSSRVSERGQITIERSARQELGVRPGMLSHQRVVNGHLEVVFLPAPQRESLYGALRQAEQSAKVVTGDQLEEAVMEAVTEEMVQPGSVDA